MMTRACVILLASAACSAPAKSTPQTTPGTDQPRTVIAPDTEGEDKQPAGDPTCPSIQVKAPDSVPAGTQARISTILVGSQATPTYTWKVTSGKLVSGQGTPTIMVDTGGLAGASVAATVELGGLSKQCVTTTANASVLVVP